MRERHVNGVGFVIVISGVAVAEGAASYVLAAQTNRGAFEHEAAEGQSLGESPVDRVIAQGGTAFFHQALQLGMNFKIGREIGEGEDHLFERQKAGASERQILRPGTGLDRTEFEELPLFFVGLGQIVDVVEVLFLRFLQSGDFFGGDYAFFFKAVTVKRGHGFVIFQMAIEDGLGVAGVIAFVMAVLAPTEDIDHYVAVKALAKIVSELRGAGAGFGVVSVDVEHGSVDHQRDIGAIAGGAGLIGIGGEADLIVDDQMNGAAGVVAINLRKVQSLGDNALPGHGGVTVDQQRDHAFAQFIFQAILLGAHDAFDHRIHGFEMTGIGSNRDANGLAAGHLAAVAGSEVILHIAGAAEIFFGDFAFEFREHLRDAFADYVREHGEAAAMRHADDALVDVAVRGAIQQFVDYGDGGFAAFE